MYRPFTFMVDNIRYITLLGLEMTPVIQKSDVVNFKNAMPFGVFMTSAIKPRPDMEKQAGVNFNTLPIADVKSAEEVDGNWIVEGSIGDKPFHLDASNLVYGDEVIFGNATTSEPVQEPKQEEPATVKEEPKQEPTKEEPEPKPAPVKEEPKSEPEPVKEEPKQEPVKEEPKTESASVKGDPEMPILAKAKEDFFYGFSFGSGKRKDSVTVLGNDGPAVGLEIGVEFVSRPTMTTPRQRRQNLTTETRPAGHCTRYPWQRVEELDERESILPKTPSVPSGIPTVAPEHVERESSAAWLKTAPIDTVDRMKQLNEMAPSLDDTPADITPTEPVQAIHEDNKEVKEAFRSTLSPEINKVIGDIPHSALGSIEAFTTVDIDFSLLEQQGEVYCIDHRWQKFGKWYCIDIVNRYARYFYNPKLGVSIEIPTTVCKEWLNIISGSQQ